MKDVRNFISPYQFVDNPAVEFEKLLLLTGFTQFSITERDEVFLYDGVENLKSNLLKIENSLFSNRFIDLSIFHNRFRESGQSISATLAAQFCGRLLDRLHRFDDASESGGEEH
jgi:hypothetical protein